MTTTIDVPDDVLKRAMLAAGAVSIEEAVLKALEEFVGRHDQTTLIPLLGTLDGFISPDQLKTMRGDE